MILTYLIFECHEFDLTLVHLVNQSRAAGTNVLGVWHGFLWRRGFQVQIQARMNI